MSNGLKAGIVAFFVLILMVGCGTQGENGAPQQNTEPSQENQTEDTQQDENTQAEENTENNQEEHNHDIALEPVEVPEDAKCSFCNMVVYGKDHELGKFSAQAIDANGHRHFFDDSGCIFNQERKAGEELQAAWVRDYNSLEWLNVDEAVVVKGEIKTPMKYGYAFFDSEEKAKQFISDHPEVNGEIVSMDQVNNVAKNRYEMKMKNMNKGNGNMNMNHGDMEME